MKYLVLYHSDEALSGVSVTEMFANAPPDRLSEGMELWRRWHEKCGTAIVDLGAPLDKSTIITKEAVDRKPTSITGYTVLEAASIDDAVALIKGHPHFHGPGAKVQVLECVRMPGM